MQAMQALIRLPEVAQVMQEMSKEMMRAGIIEEMLDETMSGVEDEEEMEEAAQSEVDKVYLAISFTTKSCVFSGLVVTCTISQYFH